MTHARSLRTAIALVAILAALAACGPRGRRPGPGPQPTGTAALKISRVLDRLAVEGFTLRSAESGFRDLAGAADLGEDAAAERAALEKNRFVRAYLKLYQRGEYTVGALAYEFRAPAGATGYMAYTIADARNNHDATLFDVAAIDGARGLTQQDEGFALRAVTFPRDTVLYSVVIGGPKVPVTEDVVRLAQTLDRLVASTA